MEILQMIVDIFNHLKLYNKIKYLLGGLFLGLMWHIHPRFFQEVCHPISSPSYPLPPTL